MVGFAHRSMDQRGLSSINKGNVFEGLADVIHINLSKRKYDANIIINSTNINIKETNQITNDTKIHMIKKKSIYS